jgi:hypothetical protein
MDTNVNTVVRRSARVDYQAGDHDDWANLGGVEQRLGARPLVPVNRAQRRRQAALERQRERPSGRGKESLVMASFEAKEVSLSARASAL